MLRSTGLRAISAMPQKRPSPAWQTRAFHFDLVQTLSHLKTYLGLGCVRINTVHEHRRLDSGHRNKKTGGAMAVLRAPDSRLLSRAVHHVSEPLPHPHIVELSPAFLASLRRRSASMGANTVPHEPVCLPRHPRSADRYRSVRSDRIWPRVPRTGVQ